MGGEHVISDKGRHLWPRPKPKLSLLFDTHRHYGPSRDNFLGGFCHRCFRAQLGLRTHDIHVSRKIFGLCSVSEFMVFMSLVGFTAR